MEQVQNWNEYCEMLEELDRDLHIEESEAYQDWLARENQRFDEEFAWRNV